MGTIDLSPGRPRRGPRVLMLAVSTLLAAFSTGASATPPLRAWLTSYHDPVHNGGMHHVLYQDISGNVDDLYYQGNTNGWQWVTASFSSGSFIPLSSYYDTTTAEGHVFGISGVGSSIGVAELHGSPRPLTGTFHGGNPIGDVGTCTLPGGGTTPCVENVSSVTTFTDGQHQHAFYQSKASDGFIHELYTSGAQWFDHALPGKSEQTNALVTQLAGVWDGSVEHVFYNNPTNSQLNELYYGGGWFITNWATAVSDGCGNTGPAFLLAATVEAGTFSAWGPSTCSNNHMQSITETPGVSFSLTNYATPHPYVQHTLAYDANGQAQAFYVGTDHLIYQLTSDGQSHSIMPGGIINGFNCDPNPPPDPDVLVATDSQGYFASITGFWDGGLRHVYFVNENNEITELTSGLNSTTWTAFDLNCAVPGNIAKQNPSVP